MVSRLKAARPARPSRPARSMPTPCSQLRHFWPLGHDGRPLPDLLDSKLPLLVPLVRTLPGHYRFTPSKDLADEIEWAKSRRLTPTTYQAAAAGSPTTPEREPPIPVDLFVKMFAGYERAKQRAGRIDFDDLLIETIDLLETDEEAAATVRARKSWISVDEYQDTNPLQQRLLDLWLGDVARRVRGRRRGPDDLHLHRGHQRVPDRLRRALPGRPGRGADPQLPVHAPGAGPGQQPAGQHRSSQAPGGDPAGRPGADRRSATAPRPASWPRCRAGSASGSGRASPRPRSRSSSG